MEANIVVELFDNNQLYQIWKEENALKTLIGEDDNSLTIFKNDSSNSRYSKMIRLQLCKKKVLQVIYIL